MQKLIFSVVGGVAAYMLTNFIVSFAVNDPRHILFLLCPAAAAIVADLWHAKAAPILSGSHLAAVFLPVIIMFAIQLGLTTLSGAARGGAGYYLSALGIYLAVAAAAFAVSAFVRTVLFSYSFDPEAAELSAYSAARL